MPYRMSACLMQRSRGFGHGVVVSKICCNAVIVLSVDVSDCCKPWQTNEQASRLSFLATVGWKWGCQPCSCPCSQNVTHCRKDICGACLFSGIHSRHSFWEFPASTPYQKLGVPESRNMLHQLCTMVVSCPSLCCSCRKSLAYREAEGLVTELWC